MMGEPSSPSSSSPQRLVRNKVALKPGRSLMHWIRYVNENKVPGVGSRTGCITLEELAEHKTEKDCWTAVRGKVYNITPYLEFHPGGIEELLKGAGIDSTTLFDQNHQWVNIESMLAKCYLGPLNVKVLKPLAPTESLTVPHDAVRSNTYTLTSIDEKPRFDWYQTSNEIFITINAKNEKGIERSDVIIDCSGGENLDVKLLLENKFFHVHFRLERQISFCLLKSISANKVEVTLTKKDPNITWPNLGLKNIEHVKDKSERDLIFRDCQIASVSAVTHNTKLFKVNIPDNVIFECAIGHHVVLKEDIEDMEIQHSYTVVAPSLIVNEISSEQERAIYLMVKNYPEGVLSPRITSRIKGEYFSMSESIGNFPKHFLKLSSVFLIAAGTGFTPMIRLINYYLIKTQECLVKLLFANRTVSDILWKDQIDEASLRFPKRFFASYVLSQPNADWSGLSGRINQSMLKEFLTFVPLDTSGENPLVLKSAEESFVAICGPDKFTELMKSYVVDIGLIPEQQIHCFLG